MTRLVRFILGSAELDIYFTKSRPYKKNDQATIVSNAEIVQLAGPNMRRHKATTVERGSTE